MDKYRKTASSQPKEKHQFSKSKLNHDSKPSRQNPSLRAAGNHPQTPDSTNFAGFILDVLKSSHAAAAVDPHAPDSLAELDYAGERRVKLEALRRFWKYYHLGGNVRELIPAPQPRNYRTTSKRRGVFVKNEFRFSLGYGPAKRGETLRTGAAGILESELHNVLYVKAQAILAQKSYEPLARVVNYCIIRGTLEEAGMVMNLSTANGELVHKLKMFGERLRKEEPRLQSLWLYVDESRSSYYFEAAARPEHGSPCKKIFGPDTLVQPWHGKKLFYPPTAFSQVNSAMCEDFTAQAMRLLEPENCRMLDLYCGYGLFSMAAAEAGADSVIGLEWDGTAISAAAGNAEHLFPGKNMMFLATAVDPAALEKKLPPPEEHEVILLDPPRSGTARGVIEALAARHADRVLHIFCGTDEIPRELKIWTSNGYHVSAVRVLDLFPGTMNVETLVLLER